MRDTLARWPVEPLTADSLTRRRANLLKVIGADPRPDLPDIAADEIRVDSTFGAKPIRVLTDAGQFRQPAARAYHGFYWATNARVTKQAERDIDGAHVPAPRTEMVR